LWIYVHLYDYSDKQKPLFYVDFCKPIPRDAYGKITEPKEGLAEKYYSDFGVESFFGSNSYLWVIGYENVVRGLQVVRENETNQETAHS